MLDINWPNRTILKSALNKTTQMFCYTRSYFKKHGQVYKIVIHKIFAIFSSSRQHKILFFTANDCDTMGRVIKQTRGQAF